MFHILDRLGRLLLGAYASSRAPEEEEDEDAKQAEALRLAQAGPQTSYAVPYAGASLPHGSKYTRGRQPEKGIEAIPTLRREVHQ